MKRNTEVEKPPIIRLALVAMALNTGCRSSGELAMTFNISAVAACCSRASLRSLLKPEIERRLTWRAVDTMLRLALAALPLFSGPALRVFDLLVLLPVLERRAISRPMG